MEEKCRACGSPARLVRGDWRLEGSGVGDVVVRNIELVRCDGCGNEDPVIPGLATVLKLVALALVRKPCPLGGAEIRYLVDCLEIGPAHFSRLLHVDPAQLDRWEKGEELLSEQADRLIRTVVLALGEGLRDQIEGAVRSFVDIRDEPCPLRIEIDAEKMEFQYA